MTTSLFTSETKALQPVRRDDRHFALQVVRREQHAVVAFRAEFADTLEDGFRLLISALADSDPPGCRSHMDVLIPHVAGAAGEGFLKSLDGTAATDGRRSLPELSVHVPSLAVSDLFHASACLASDGAACRRLIRMVDDEIGPSLIRRFRQRLAPGRCEQIVQDLLSQAWSAPRTSQHSNLSGAENPPAGQRRLEKYFGMSALKTWLYSMGFRMLQDETRSLRDRERSIDEDETALVPVAPESPPDEIAALRELTSRFKPRLTESLAAALLQLRDRSSPRLYHVAYLWLSCRIPQVAIAEMLEVSKPRISQQVKEIADSFLEATASVRGELVAATGMDDARLTETLREHLSAFFPPVMEQLWLDELRRLQSTRPQLVQLAYLLWRERVEQSEIADQLDESPSRVTVLTRQLDDWRRAAGSRIAQQLSTESTVPVELLEQAAQIALTAGFSSELTLCNDAEEE